MSDRESFEKFISSPPFEKSVDRWPDNPDRHAWPGAYKQMDVRLAWECWKEAMEKRLAVVTAERDFH